jgi:hypothetical protein
MIDHDKTTNRKAAYKGRKGTKNMPDVNHAGRLADTEICPEIKKVGLLRS